jgi:hypothetical protein
LIVVASYFNGLSRQRLAQLIQAVRSPAACLALLCRRVGASRVRQISAEFAPVRGFRVLKNEIEFAPVFHRLPQRIRAHALICFLALVLYRVLRMPLRAHGGQYSPERALEIAAGSKSLNQRHSAAGLTTLSDQQREPLDAVDLTVPVRNAL